MVWGCYILNEFIEDFLDSKNLGKEFHYSWIFLLLAMVLWKALKALNELLRLGPCLEIPISSSCMKARTLPSKNPMTQSFNS
jgi:hypothetical protein